MILTYGGYAHPTNEVSFSVDAETIFNDFQQGRGSRVTYTIHGVKIGSSAADLTSKLAALQAAYGTNGGDLLFYDNSGNLTQHYLLNSECLGGTRVKRRRWLPGNPGIWGSGTEYVNKRTFEIVVEGDVIARGGLLRYHESIASLGTGGQKKRWITSLTGDPQLQLLEQKTTFTVVQSGIAVGDLTWPTPSTPMWPDYEHQEKRRIRREHPRIINGNYTEFAVSWQYEFEAPQELAGGPIIISS